MRAPSTEEIAANKKSAHPLTACAPSERPTVAIVDLAALYHNFQEVRKRTEGRKVLAVVKARAYGHGAVRVSRQLLDLGADMLGVALVEEGRELREAGIRAPILVMGAVFPGQADEIIRLGLIPAIATFASARALSESARKQGTGTAAVHVKIDTGMGRLGLSPESVPEFITNVLKLGNLAIEGLMTHFADADLRDKQFASLQMDRYERLVGTLEKRGMIIPVRHAANSAAVLDFRRALFTMVRPGLMLYGYDPLEGGRGDADLWPVLSLATRIAFLKRVPAGTPVSYGRTFVTKRESYIATIPIGYADGYGRGLSNNGEVLVHGTRAPVVGRVCMDMTMIDVTDVPEVHEGDEVILIGRQGNERITAGEIASRIGTIPYEILCDISDRVPRVYME